MKKQDTFTKGSITVEAAISLPFFIIAIMSFVFIIKVYYIHEIVQQAINGACNEISVYSLIYYETNAEEIIGGIERFSNSEKVEDALGDNAITAFLQQIGKDASDYIRTQAALVPIAKTLVKRNLEVTYYENPDDRLKNLHLNNGFDSIDFTTSKMLADDKSIDITAKYEISLPFLSQILPGFKITQTASSCVWAGEDGVKKYSAENSDQDTSIWNWSNIKRGREIQRLQGANLPYNFPTVAKYENGTATSIKSLNIDKAYYRDSGNLKLKLVTYINKLDEFNGGKSGSISIERYQILKKELLLVIPETEVLPNQQQTLEECIQIARNKGISMKIIKAYGKENTEQNKAENEVDNDKSD